jgi:hypothetical protein
MHKLLSKRLLGLRAHLTFSNVVSVLALFVALSGGAYALTVPQGSVGTRQLKNNAVTSAKVKNRSLQATDFKLGQLAAGAQGPKGDTGATGAQGPKGDTGPAGTITGVTAGGDLTGTFPNPQLRSSAVGTAELSTDARGVALAGAIVAPTGTVETYFNRFGGPPTVAHTATGWYEVTFPGLTAWYIATPPVVTLIGTSSAGLVSASTSGGKFYVVTSDAGGTASDRRFSLICFPMSASG